MKISTLTQSVINCGVTPDLKIEEAQIVKLTNLFGMIPMVFFVIYIFNGIVYDIPFFYQIGLINMLFNMLAIFCNYKGLYALSKTVLLAANSIILFLLVNIVEGNSSGVAFFFPVLTCYVVFYDIMKELRTVLINLAITAVCVLLCLMLPDHTLGHVSLPAYMSGNITKMNYLLAFTAFAFYVFTIIKVKLQSETLLIQSIETAEIMANKSEQIVNQLMVQKQKAEQATQIKAMFLTEVSDEIRTPAEKIIEVTNNLSGKDIAPQIDGEIGVLRTSLSDILLTVNEVDHLHKAEQGKIKPERKIIKLKELVHQAQEAIAAVAERGLIDVSIQVDETIPKEIISDDQKIVHALVILIEHSIKHFQADKVNIQMQPESSRNDNMMLAFRLTWNGSSSGNLKSGTGYRLTLCEKLVEMLGGRLTITAGNELHSAEFKLPVKLVSSAGK